MHTRVYFRVDTHTRASKHYSIHSCGHMLTRSWVHVLATWNVKNWKIWSIKKAIDLFEIRKKRNNANFRARLLDCPATPREILISRQWNKQKSSASRDRHELRPNLVLWTPPPHIFQVRIFPNVPGKKRPRIPIELATLRTL